MAKAETIVQDQPKEEPSAKVLDHPARKTPKVHPTRFKNATGARNVWYVVPEHGTAFDALLEPSYWAHVAQNLRPTDRIEVNAEDGSYFAELMVIAGEQNSAKVTLLRKHDIEANAGADKTGAFEVKWRGPHHKYSVVRLSDNEPVQTSFDTNDAALTWLAANVKNLTA